MQYAQTTLMIFGWCLVIGVSWVVVLFEYLSRNRALAERLQGQKHSIFPCLLVAPIVVALVYRFFSVSLIFPTQFHTSATAYIWLTIPPAIILLFGSGYFLAAAGHVARETLHWRAKPFAVAGQAYGFSLTHSLRKLVVMKALALSWSLCLPWIFGELVVVEAVFNAPGLGLQIWNLAKNREISALLLPLLTLAFTYGLAALCSAILHRNLGRRLETYG
jgi:ABC-type dipeptide/oligopeptide/nickel transport system permease component